MGRNKILISKIQNDKKRNSTFAKRKNGLIKKAMELSILCGCEISLIILNPGKSMNIYCSTDLNTTLKMVNSKLSRNDYLTNADYPKYYGGTEGDFIGCGDDDDDDNGSGEQEDQSGSILQRSSLMESLKDPLSAITSTNTTSTTNNKTFPAPIMPHEMTSSSSSLAASIMGTPSNLSTKQVKNDQPTTSSSSTLTPFHYKEFLQFPMTSSLFDNDQTYYDATDDIAKAPFNEFKERLPGIPFPPPPSSHSSFSSSSQRQQIPLNRHNRHIIPDQFPSLSELSPALSQREILQIQQQQHQLRMRMQQMSRNNLNIDPFGGGGSDSGSPTDIFSYENAQRYGLREEIHPQIDDFERQASSSSSSSSSTAALSMDDGKITLPPLHDTSNGLLPPFKRAKK